MVGTLLPTRDRPDEVRQPVQVWDYERPLLRLARRHALGPANDGPCNVECRRTAVLPWDNELLWHHRLLGELIYARLQRFHHLEGNETRVRNELAAVRRRRRHLCHQYPEVSLEPNQKSIKLGGIGGLGPRNSKCSLSFVDGTVQLYALGALRNPATKKQPSGPVIAPLRVYPHAWRMLTGVRR